MTATSFAKERAQLVARINFIDAVTALGRKQAKAVPYDCQQYSIARMCRFDRRAADRKCDGCPRTTDKAYLVRHGLWVDGVSHSDETRGEK